MKTNVIRKKIEAALRKEKETGALVKLAMKVAKENGRQLSKKGAEEVRDFVIIYVNAVPETLEEGWKMSGQFGIRQEMNQMLSAIEAYWIEVNDVIPDHQGLIGITDDAYASLYLMQTISDYCKQMSGRPLLSTDLTASNKLIRGLLGVQVASVLEQSVGVTIAQSMAGQVLNQMYQNIFSSGFSFSNYMNAYSSQRQIEDQVNLQMGAMGIGI